MASHMFDTAHAEKYGINCAILLQNIIFWSKKNSANKNNIFDGHVWIFNSVNAWKELFPYMGESQIKTALKKLEDMKVIKSGNYNKVAYDRTKWYAIIDRCICENESIHLVVLANGTDDNSQPIPDIKPDSKQHINYDEFFSSWNSFATTCKKKTILKMTEGRKNKIKTRFKEIKEFEKIFKIALEKASNSKFLCESEFFSMDWLIDNDTNLVKVIEDKYKNKETKYEY